MVDNTVTELENSNFESFYFDDRNDLCPRTKGERIVAGIESKSR